MSEKHKPSIAILASGGGSTAEAYARGIHDGITNAEVRVVIASNESAGIKERVQRWNSDWGFDTQAITIGNTTHPTGPRERGQTRESSEAICEALSRHNIDLVLQLGYMVIGNDPYISEWGFDPERHSSAYQSRALNWHPGLLPLTRDTYGEGASEVMIRAFQEGRIAEAIHTIHAVAQEVDAGPIVAEHPVPIMPDDKKDTLFDRVQLIEKAITPYAPDRFLRLQSDFLDGNS